MTVLQLRPRHLARQGLAQERLLRSGQAAVGSEDIEDSIENKDNHDSDSEHVATEFERRKSNSVKTMARTRAGVNSSEDDHPLSESSTSDGLRR